VAEKKLNREQLKAVNHNQGPLLVIAGAGTGKTTVITERIKRLIADGLCEPQEILALTFTEKAAREMEERIDQAMPYGYTQMWVMTFHSFCDRILHDEGIHIGLNSNYKLITGIDTLSLMRRHLFSLDLEYFRPLGNPNKFISGMITHFDRLRDEDISPKDYSTWIDSKDTADEMIPYREMSGGYSAYQQIKLKENVLDFADLITYTLRLFRERPNILKIYQSKFKYILVDEFQDTNFAQNQLINILASKSKNLTVVADDDQSIYRWRGAAVSNVLQFKKTYPQSELVVLNQNYRSSQEILDSAYKLIQNNNPDRLEVKQNINKHLISKLPGPGFPPEFLHYTRVEHEAEGVAKKVKMLIESENYSPSDFAVLVRANAHSYPFIIAFSRLGIPSQFLGPGKLFDQPEVKDLIAYLRVLKDPADDQSFYRVLSMEHFSVRGKDLVSLSAAAKKQNRTLYQTCSELSGIEISSETQSSVTKLISIINNQLDQLNKETAGQLLFNFLKDSGLLSAILNYQLPMDEIKAGNITKFFNKIKSFETINTDASVIFVLDWIDLSYEVGESPTASDSDWTQNDAVNILTLHSAKGLEFPVVFLVNLVSQRFPSTEKKEQIPIPDELIKEEIPQGDFHLQEERRLFYVGITRAKQRLFLTAADYYGEAKRIKKISPFVVETLGEEIVNHKSLIVNQPSLLDWNKSDSSVVAIRHEPLTISYLSYSQIQTFLDCPMHYKAKYLLNIKAPPSAASGFGNTIHRTLRDYFDALIRKAKPDILEIYSHNWTAEGYQNSRHADLYFKKGQKYLTEYLFKNPPESLPAKLEESFTLPIGDIKIGGKIDRVDVLPDGSIEIIDYKTSSKIITPKEAQKNLQLSFYALAASKLPNSPFSQPPEKIKLSLYYFENQAKISVYQTPEQLDLAQYQILDYARQIENSDFRCSHSLICQKNCDYHTLCDIDNPDG
jgi:DNA helicase-2/ATP-dependent DNA helicase PcrA